ncbi:MAG: PEGA domain-containing protein [Candidatus Dojkabacteria bacterium]|nr:PEGA domain-containing protein [Candidatus Dojkabacteria bacterium]
MKQKSKKQLNRLFEEALNKVYKDDVPVDKTFQKNLDKLVENTISLQKLAAEHQEGYDRVKKKRSFLGMFFQGVKWQVAMLSSVLAVLFVGGVTYAAVPSVRNAVNDIFISSDGSINVNSVPERAEVYLKGVDYTEYTLIGTTPIVKKLKEGNYKMRILLNGYEKYEASFTISSGKSQSYEISLVEKESVLDKIKEWKTYVDLMKGFEFTYPLSWSLVKDNLGLPVKVVGENSYFQLSSGTNEQSDLVSFDIEGDEYMGLIDHNGYDYIVKDKIADQDGTMRFNIEFATKDETEIEIYKFILDSIKVYSKAGENGTVGNWLTFARAEYGFSLKYPETDWIVIEKKSQDTFAEFSVESQDENASIVTVVYSLGYWEGLENFTYSRDNEINSYQTKTYTSSNGQILYEFPNRLFVIKESGQDDETDKIISSFKVTKPIQYQVIYDYTFDYSMVLPDSWTYTTEIDNEIFDGSAYANISNHSGNIRIYNWEDVQSDLNEYLESILSTNVTYQVSSIRIADSDYTKLELWEIIENSKYKLGKTLFNDFFDNEFTSWNNEIKVGESGYFIVSEADIETENYSKLPTESQKFLLQAEAVVSSLRSVEY